MSTSSTKKPWSKLPIVLFLGLIALPVPVDRYLAKEKVPLPGRAPFRESKVVDKDFLDGKAADKLEKNALNESHVGRWLTARHNEIVYATLRRTPPSSWVGSERWLFIPERVREFPEAHWNDLVEHGADTIGMVNSKVEENGARLVVALVPDRSRIYPDKAYRRGQMPPGKAAFLEKMTAALEKRGVAVVNLTDALREARERRGGVFYPDDHHWTAVGAQAAVQALVSNLDERHSSLLVAKEKSPRYQEIWAMQSESEHSLTRRLGFRPKGKLERRFYGRGATVKHTGRDARGFPQSCATYWSTSYGRFGSPRFFANEAKCPVRILYRDGAGSGRIPLEDIGRLAKTPHLGGRHLVVWEIPEYHMVEPPPKMATAFTFLAARLEKKR